MANRKRRNLQEINTEFRDKIRNMTDQEIQEQIIGMEVTYDNHRDAYIHQIKEVKRKGNTIVLDSGNVFTFRTQAGVYRLRGYNFGILDTENIYKHINLEA
jgi:thermostable 8-oxoguanine DNA glycosylase